MTMYESAFFPSSFSREIVKSKFPGIFWIVNLKASLTGTKQGAGQIYMHKGHRFLCVEISV